MPFGPVLQPAIGVSLLKAQLKDVPAKILYFSLPFAERIGMSLYNWIAVRVPSVICAVGEWTFSGALFGSNPLRAKKYLNRILRHGAFSNQVPEKTIRRIHCAHEMASVFVDECLEQVLRYAPRIVGFTDSFQQQVASLTLAKRLKEKAPDTFILFGGANCEGVMGLEVVRQFSFVDAVVCGEADLVFSEIIHRILDGQSLADLPGVYTRESPAVHNGTMRPAAAPAVHDMDALPYPDYEDFFQQWNASGFKGRYTPLLPFETSRGCWWGEKHHCTFCGLNGLTMHHRSKTARRALEELLELVNRYPGCPVAAVDNILDMKYFRDFVPELGKRRLKIRVYYEVKANLSKEQVRLLRDAGITGIQPGIESLSDSVLKLMRKGVTGLQNIQLLKWCKELGVRPYWNLIWGFPGENPEEYSRVADLVPLLTHLAPPEIAMPICLYRFSPNFDHSAVMGFTNVSPCPAYHFIYPFESGVLANLAYYFSYDYREPRDVALYTRALARRVADWQSLDGQSELFYLDGGTHLLVWDFRPIASRSLTILRGLQRRLYLACDRIHSLTELARQCNNGSSLAVGTIEEALQPLLSQGLMIREGERLLSLAVGKPAQESAAGSRAD